MTTAAIPRARIANPTKRSRRWLRRAIVVAFVAIAFVLLVLAAVPKAVPVETARVTRGPMIVTVDETAKTRVRDRYVVDAPLAGDLLRPRLEPGDPVATGAVLARIVPIVSPLLDPRSRSVAESRVAAALAAERQAMAARVRAEAAAEHAHIDAEDARRLLKTGAIGSAEARNAELDERMRGQELESARFAVQVATSEADLARAALKRFRSAAPGEELAITAPVSGVVLHVLHESAGVVQPGTAILEIGDVHNLEVVCDVLTSDAVSVHPGARVRFERWGGDQPLEGHVRLVEPAAFTKISALGVEEQRVSVIIDLDVPADVQAKLGDGYRLDARIVVWENRDVRTVPSSAVFRSGGAWAVYVVKSGRARLASVGVGKRNQDQVEITSGLEDGQTVVVHPSDRLSPGTRVTTR